MARNEPCPSAKGKAKAYEPPTRASPWLAALRSQAVANSQLKAPVTPTTNVLTLSLPPKKCPIQKTTSKGISKAAARSFRRRSQRIAAIGRTFFQASEEQEVIPSSNHPTIKKPLRLVVTRSQNQRRTSQQLCWELHRTSSNQPLGAWSLPNSTEDRAIFKCGEDIVRKQQHKNKRGPIFNPYPRPFYFLYYAYV
ncbi:hypothetical protein PIB30_041709 [Stylosanthes scabra]|uniref:Uncharacterized protein n=1 Tax=Stylosanthes scabra TaxID=79078 RepID=A0ABU6WEZ8_9FABA|nr:hypothetical protein [Stylosanthes scabra]